MPIVAPLMSWKRRNGLFIVDLEMQRCRDVERLWVIISMMVKCNDNVIMKYDGRRSGLPKAPVIMEHDNNIPEK